MKGEIKIGGSMTVTLRCGASLTPRAFRLCVLDCDGVIFNSNRLKTNAYRATLAEIGVRPEHVDAFVELHLSDVSVSRFVKFQRFFADVLPEAARPALGNGEEGGSAVERLVARALDGYSRNCPNSTGADTRAGGCFVQACQRNLSSVRWRSD